ncbi:hypothetical protein ACOSQ2_007071 [Xanthoceras sorbifolium]
MASDTVLGPSVLAGKPISDKPETDEATMISLIYQSMNMNLGEGKPPMGLTENLSPTFLSTGNPCLDFFFHVVPDTPSDQLIPRLEVSWAHDPLTTLKLICNLRGVRGTGKSDKENFYMAAFWLYQKHPKTLSSNARVFADFGYFKDLPEILFRLLEGPEKRKMLKEEWMDKKRAKIRALAYAKRLKREAEWRAEYLEEEVEEEENVENVREMSEKDQTEVWEKKQEENVEDVREMSEKHQTEVPEKKQEEESVESVREMSKKDQTEVPEKKQEESVEDGKKTSEKETEVLEKKQEESVENVKEKEPVITKEEARVLRKAREAAQVRKALEKYKSDSNYRLFYDTVCDVFAEVLKFDMGFLKANELSKISLAAKWCPSIDSSYDKATLICEGIARRIFPRESDKEYDNLEEAHYVYRVRDRLRKQVLVPLRKVLQLPEVFMSANEWKSLPYGRVPSVAMKNYKNLFQKHDKERFEEYLEKVKSGKAKIAAGALLPHEIVKSAKQDSLGEVAELQWKRMVEDVSKKGKLTNCMAVCDVSGSMSGTPMEVCVALGILVSELSEEPWKGKLITFSENPELHLVEGDSLKDKSAFVEAMNWGMNTDFQKVFDKILEVAAENNLSEDQLIKRLFVFSDMEFDSANVTDMRMSESINEMDSEEMEAAIKEQSKGGWETDYEVIQWKFKEHGYSKVPEIVFWNLRNSFSTPVVAKQTGVSMVSGFSKNLVTLFLDQGGIVNPEDVMRLALAGEEYQKLVVYD